MAVQEVWLQQLTESARAFAAFEVYRDCGAERSLQLVADKTGKALRTIQRYSTAHNWVERVRDFDLFQQNRARTLLDEELRADARAEADKWRQRRQEFREEVFDYGNKLLERAKEMLRYPLAEATRNEDGKTTIIKPVRWNANSIVHTIRLAYEMKMLATGLAPGSHPLDEVDFDKLSMEDLDRILSDQPITISKEKH